jgi:hypothetical protein
MRNPKDTKFVWDEKNFNIIKETLHSNFYKEEIIGKKFTLDLSSLTPVEVKVIEIIDSNVIVEYLNSTQGRIEKYSISDFEYFSGIKIKKNIQK